MKNENYRKKTVLIDTSMVYGKIPPHATDVEEAILGAIMMQKNAFDVVSDILTRDSFYQDHHQRIFSAMAILAGRNAHIDEISVMQELIKQGELENVGGPVAITKLTSRVTSNVGLEEKCRIVLEKFLKRELIKIGGITVNEGYEETMDVFDAINNLEVGITSLTSGTQGKTYTGIDEGLVKSIARISELRRQDRHVTGVHTGYSELDKITHGWQNTDLIILAARPSVGKTAFALNLAKNAASHPDHPIGVGIFSLEMSEGQLINRMLSADSEVNLDHITNGRLSDDQFEKINRHADKMSGLNIKIDDTAAMNVFQLRSKARRMKRKHNIGLIIIDYLQLMSGVGDRKGQNREQEISTISRELKNLAKELEVPIIALSQLSRDVEKRKGEIKMPQLSDLRDSGAIEQDADIVTFLYRPEYHDVTQNEMGESNKGETHLKIAKHRNGELGMIKFTAQLWIQRFVPFEGTAIVENGAKGNWRPVKESEKSNNELIF